MRSNETNYYMQTYMFKTFRSVYANGEIHIKGAKVPGNENSREQKFHRTFVPGSEKAWERKGKGAKGPRSESCRERIGQGPIGRFAPGSKLARERKGSVPFFSALYHLEHPHISRSAFYRRPVEWLLPARTRCDLWSR